MTKGQEIAAEYDDVFVRDTAPLAEAIDTALRTAAEEARAKALEEAAGVARKGIRRAERDRGAERIVRLLSALYEVADLATIPRSPASEAEG